MGKLNCEVQARQGVISVVSKVVAADVVAMIGAFENGDLKRARELHYKLAPLVGALFVETNPVLVKAALAMMGKIEYDVRLPLCRMLDANYEKLRKAMLDYGLISIEPR